MPPKIENPKMTTDLLVFSQTLRVCSQGVGHVLLNKITYSSGSQIGVHGSRGFLESIGVGAVNVQ